MDYRLKLVSYKICPYVQRSIITLLHKNIDFEVIYIDLANKPDWFLKRSPLGKVPILLVNKDAVIFESAVINEFISEIYPPSLHPVDPVRRAHNRAWIEYSSYLQNTAFRLHTAPNQAAFNQFSTKLRKQLAQLEGQLGTGPFFNGDVFHLIDASYAPFFMRQEIVDRLTDCQIYEGFPRVASWSKSILSLPEVQRSVVPEYADLFHNFLSERDSIFAPLPV